MLIGIFAILPGPIMAPTLWILAACTTSPDHPSQDACLRGAEHLRRSSDCQTLCAVGDEQNKAKYGRSMRTARKPYNVQKCNVCVICMCVLQVVKTYCPTIPGQRRGGTHQGGVWWGFQSIQVTSSFLSFQQQGLVR